MTGKKKTDPLPGEKAFKEANQVEKLPSGLFLRTRLLATKLKLKLARSADETDRTATDILKVCAGVVLVFTGSGVVLPVTRLIVTGTSVKVGTWSYKKWAHWRGPKIAKRVTLLQEFRQFQKEKARLASEEAAPSMA